MLERFIKALAATHSIKDSSKLSIATALKLFHVKISPTASYGIRIRWEKLTEAGIALLDGIKTTFSKRVLGLHSSALNRIVYPMGATLLYVEDLTEQFGLRDTEAYTEFLRIYEEKLASVDGRLLYTRGVKVETVAGHSATSVSLRWPLE